MQSGQSQSAITRPPRGSFTQGLLFCGGVAPGYEGCDTFGIAITARCDAANDKVHTYNYLPVVALDDWLHRDGKHLLAYRLRTEAMGSLAKLLKDSGYSEAVIETEPPEVVVERLFPQNGAEKKDRDARKRAETILERYRLAQRAAQSSPTDRVCLQISSGQPKLVAAMIDDLVRHKLPGYYFLERVDADSDDRGYVVLLREIQAIPRELTHLVLNGLDRSIYDDACNKFPEYRGTLQFGKMDISMPLGLLRSPNVEHLLQTFATLFGRIGLPDTAPTYIASLWSRQPSVMETNS